MSSETSILTVVALPGLQLDSLGNYLASLGVMRLLSHKWSSVRVAWRSGVFHVVGGPANFDEVLDAISEVGWKREWAPYERSWADAQKKSTKAKSGRLLTLWQVDVDERDLELLAAHVVPASRIAFNPLLGSGGNAGKRDFAKGWQVAIDALGQPKPSEKSRAKKRVAAAPSTTVDDEKAKRRGHLRSWLLGDPVTWLLEGLNAASWFPDANKLFNSGQRPFREGGISPWAMALACEGLVFFAGGASRRLGARSRSVGAFPFVTRAAAPEGSDEVGCDLAEVWAPLWDRPMTTSEVRTLFARGRAEVDGRGVLTSSGFATAVVGRGVDAGISEFRRFVLGRTTSANTFESRFEGTFPVADSDQARSTRASSTTFVELLSLVDQLRRVAESWNAPASWLSQYVGPLEAAMVAAVSAPDNPERASALLDATVAALDRLDRNHVFRERKIAWRSLPLEWLPILFYGNAPPEEARLALSLVSGFSVARPFTLYRFGVNKESDGRFVHSHPAPARWRWRTGPLANVLCNVLLRTVLDWEVDSRSRKSSSAEQSRRAPFVLYATHQQIERWLSGQNDDGLLAAWISRLALFDWSFVPPAVKRFAAASADPLSPSAGLCLYGALQPFFDERATPSTPGMASEKLLSAESGARTPAVARAIASLLRAGQVGAAMRLAKTRYAMARSPLIESSVPWNIGDSERLLASFLFSVRPAERTALAGRWLRPKRQGGHVHA